MKKKIFSMIIAVLMMFMALPMTPVIAAQDSNLMVYYDFDGNFVDELGGSQLTLIDTIESGNTSYGNTTSSFGSGSGSDGSYWQWTSNKARGGGFVVDVNDLDIADNYTIGVRFMYDNISSSWDKIIDYKNRASDAGFYFYGRRLQFYPISAAGPSFSASTIIDLIATRNASTGRFIVYMIENGALNEVYNFDDSANQYSKPIVIDGKVRLGFFHDDKSTSNEATSGGKVYSLKIWDGPITAEQATGAMETPNRISFNGNGATGGATPSDILANEGVDVTIPTNVGSLVKPGMHISSWNSQADGEGDTFAFGSTYTIPEEDTVLFAKWEANSYSVNFNANGGFGVMPQQDFTYGIPETLIPNEFVNPGKLFMGWATTVDGPVQYIDEQDGSIMLGDNDTIIQLYAQWEAIEFTLSYITHMPGLSYPDESFIVGQAITPPVPNIPGYTFLGWYWESDFPENIIQENSNGNGILTPFDLFDDMPPMNVTLIAKWEAIDYTFTFDPNFGSEANVEQIFQVGGDVAGTTFTREGFIFLGWTTDVAGETAYSGGLTNLPAEDIYVYAQWEEVLPEEFVLTYVTNQPELTIENVLFIEGDAIVAPEPTKEGFNFLGWYADEALTIKFDQFSSMPGENVIVYGNWGEVLGEEDQLPDTSDNSQSTDLGLLFLMLGALAMVISKKEKIEVE